jgi:hypothetical protein
MPYYKVTKTMKYTATVYVEAESKYEAENRSGGVDGESNNDDIWNDSEAQEITESEYLEDKE